MRTLMLLLILSGCAPIEVEDVQVVHSLDVQSVERYFEASCAAQYPWYTQAQVEACADAKVGEFLSGLGGTIQ